MAETNENSKRLLLKSITDEDDLQTIDFYLSLAKNAVLNKLYPFGGNAREVPEKYEALQMEIAAYLIGKRGAEGETVHSENGVSRTYESAEIPQSMLKQIVPFAGTFGGERE